MEKRRSQAAFSLFSFQDIITSVTAILILIMLLLTLEMISRRRMDAVADPTITRRHLETIIDSLEGLASRLRDDVAKATQDLVARKSRAELDADMRKSETELAVASARLTETQRTRTAVALARREADERAAQMESQRDVLAAVAADAERDREEADRLERANQQAHDGEMQRRRSGAELVFNPPQQAGRRSWMLVIHGDGIDAFHLGAERQESLGLDTGLGSALARWIEKLDREGDQCLLLLRPSADHELVVHIESALDAVGVPYGMDLVGEEQTVRIGSAVASGRPG